MASISAFFVALGGSIATYFAANALAFGLRYGVPLLMVLVLAAGWYTGSPWTRTLMGLSGLLVAVASLEISGKLPALSLPPAAPRK
jgi:hypothetical protein